MCACVCATRGGVVWCIILHILCQGQSGQWQGMEQKASQGTACDRRPHAAHRTGRTHTQIETLTNAHPCKDSHCLHGVERLPCAPTYNEIGLPLMWKQYFWPHPRCITKVKPAYSFATVKHNPNKSLNARGTAGVCLSVRAANHSSSRLT